MTNAPDKRETVEQRAREIYGRSPDVFWDVSGETVLGMRVAAYRETHPEHGNKFGHIYSEHWSTPNYRHPNVKVERLFTEKQVRDLIQQQQATIERLSAALERAIEAIQAERDCTVECATVGPAHDLSTLDPGAKPYVEEQDAMLAYLRTALGKDAK